ncbi:TetR/AcrR family transcriptional regulator [Paenibacillus sp. FSL K6-1096]|uniref:TetR/AcrR family transcriptional regulator n=1 Tax=Paenibacillus sp. FSL K6-1096 TaxID=2921460 RepID=UPI0030EE536C
MPDEKTSRAARRTRLALKLAFVELILEKEYEAVTILDVANRADYNRGTFYKHYNSKEDLLRDIHDDFLLSIADALVRPYQGLKQIDTARIAPSIQDLFLHIEQHKSEFLALAKVSREKLHSDLIATLHHSMSESMHIELKPAPLPIEYEILLSYQISATVGVIMYWADTNFKYSTSYMADQLLGLINTPIDHITFRNHTSRNQ